MSTEEFPGHGGPTTVGDLAGLGPHRLAIAARPLSESEFGTLLRAAATQNYPDVFRDMIFILAYHLGVEVPNGVFVTRRGSAGRPAKDLTRRIYDEWVSRDRPTLDKEALSRLAEKFHPKEWKDAAADLDEQKHLRERVRGSILRSILALRNRP